METIILICCIVIIILLVAIFIRQFMGGGDYCDVKSTVERLINMRENDNRMFMEQSSKQSEATLNQIDRLGHSICDIQKQQSKPLSDSIEKIENHMNSLRRENQESLNKINSTVTEKMQSILDNRLNNVNQTVVSNITSLARVVNDNQEKQRVATIESLNKQERSIVQSLDKINETVNEKLQKTLDDRISKSFEAVNQRLKEVYEGLGEMKNVASGVNDLKNVLSNVKTRGTLGEIQLGAILEEIFAPEQYGSYVKLDPNSNKDEYVDFAVKLPGIDDNGIWLPIDSKFPGDTYAALLKSYESANAELVKSARKTLTDEIKRCAKSISEKYIKTPYTTNFAIMFLPFEGLYAEVVNMGLIEKLQQDYKVNVAGPSTMAAMLNSLQMGFKTLAIQKKSSEVWKVLEDAKKEFLTFADVLNKTRMRLRQADDDLEKLIGTRTNQINRKLAMVSAIEDDSNNSTEN